MLVNRVLVLLAALLAPAAALPHDDDAVVEARGSSSTKYSAKQVIKELGLIPNVEKGYFVETFRDPETNGNRSVSTAIYYLLEGWEGKSIWHKVDKAEVWHYYAGAPLNLFLSNNDGRPVRKRTLGPEILRGQRPQVVIAANEWQQAQSTGKWTLVGTTVAPGFVPEGFELAPPGWKPKGA